MTITGICTLGVTYDDLFGATAVIGEGVKLSGTGYIYVMAGATVPEDFEDLPAVALKADGKEFLTIFAGSAAVEVCLPAAPLTNAEFKYWIVDDDIYDARDFVPMSELKGLELSAVKDTKIYPLTVNYDEGIASVYVDGILVDNTGAVDDLEAGKHTIAYQIKSGYEGTPALKLVKGTAVVSGMEITLSGVDKEIDDDYQNITVQLSGTKPVTPTPTPTPEPTPIIIEEDDSFGITQILLIALVIMIGVLVVVLILRFNRS